MPDVSDRRPMITPKIQLVATFKQEMSQTDLEIFSTEVESVLVDEYGDFIDSTGSDFSVNSISVTLISALWLDDVDKVASVMEQVIEQQGAEVDGGIQIQAITERTVV